MTCSTTSAPWSNASTPGSRTNSAPGSCACAAPSRSNAISCSASSPSPSIKYSACPRCKKLRVDQLAAQVSEKSRASQIMQEALERALAERDPDNPDLRDTAAACLDGLASAKIAMGDRQGALSDYKESVALTRKLADEQQDVEYQRQLDKPNSLRRRYTKTGRSGRSRSCLQGECRDRA